MKRHQVAAVVLSGVMLITSCMPAGLQANAAQLDEAAAGITAQAPGETALEPEEETVEETGQAPIGTGGELSEAGEETGDGNASDPEMAGGEDDGQNSEDAAEAGEAEAGEADGAAQEDDVQPSYSGEERTGEEKPADEKTGDETPERPDLEDFGWYTKVCPGAIFYIGIGEAFPALHTEGYDFPDAILPAAVQMFRAILTSC